MRRMYLYLSLFWVFLLGSHDGFLALWIPPAEEPAAVFPCRVSSLPPADARLLEKGISVDTREELMGLLEDFIS